MEGTSIIIPVYNKADITKKCVDQIEACNSDTAYEIIIVDNNSVDETAELFSNHKNVIYIRSEVNIGVAGAYNLAFPHARYDVVCFMHNDVLIYEREWIRRLRDFIGRTEDVGIVGLYGAKTMRKDGTFRGKTIVHALRSGPSIKNDFERVAVVDGLLLAMRKSVFEKVQGFNTAFSIHYYDKDISLRAATSGLSNYVLAISFDHLCGSTRMSLSDEDNLRNAFQKTFVEIWANHLPVDVSTWRDKIGYLLVK